MGESNTNKKQSVQTSVANRFVLLICVLSWWGRQRSCTHTFQRICKPKELGFLPLFCATTHDRRNCRSNLVLLSSIQFGSWIDLEKHPEVQQSKLFGKQKKVLPCGPLNEWPTSSQFNTARFDEYTWCKFCSTQTKSLEWRCPIRRSWSTDSPRTGLKPIAGGGGGSGEKREMWVCVCVLTLFLHECSLHPKQPTSFRFTKKD